jgi:hypothetical protein
MSIKDLGVMTHGHHHGSPLRYELAVTLLQNFEFGDEAINPFGIRR